MAFFPKLSSVFLSSALLVCSGTTYASQTIPLNPQYVNLLNETRSLNPNTDDLKNTERELWEKFMVDAQTLTTLKIEHDAHALKFKDKTMKFTVSKLGEPGENGYPLYIALHGGGGAPPSLNDSQWQHMSIYYKSSVKSGVYVAPRGVTDTWNLHFVDESYPLYERLIENMVLYENVDPNRVYFLGFSAGGDGVYQVVPRMADRFAAANMSAGHHNWINFDNLYNTPFVIQVGEYDSAYNRNKVGAENYLAIQALNQKYGGGYVSDLFVHVGYAHNGWPDNNPQRPLANVIADPQKWLTEKDRTSKKVNTNAIDWLDQFTRNPVPTKVVWDLSTGATTRTSGAGQALLNAQSGGYAQAKLALPHELFYWLDVSVADEFPANGKLIIEFNKDQNAVHVLEASHVNKFRVLLNSDMLDLSKPVRVSVGNQVISVQAQPNVATMTRTLLERGDKNYMFDAEFTLNNQNGVWVTE